MVASSLLSDAAFVSDGSSYAVHQLVLLLGSAMTALNACVEAKEKEATWEVTTHHCLASLGFIAGFVPFLKDASILEDFCRYVMSVLPCVLEANLADEVLVKDVVLLMEKMSRFVDGEKRDDVMGEMESVVVEKKVLVSTELEKRCEEEEESDSSSYTYESYYSYETVSDEELPPSMPTLVSAPEKPAKEEKKPVEEEEDWGFEEEEKKDEDWGFDEKEEEKEEVKEPVEENVEVKKVEVKEDKKDKKAEVNEEKKEEKPEEKKVKEEVKEEKKPVEEKKAEVKKEEEEKPEEKEEKPVEEKKKEPSADKNSTSTALARTEKKLEVDEHLWDDDDEPVKPARATRRGRKKEEVKEEKKAEVKKEEKEEEKPVAKPVEEAKPEVKKEEKPVEEKPEEKTEEKEEKKVEVKKEEEKKPSVDKNSTSTALARTEKKLEVDEHLWDDDDEPVKPARATRRGRKKEKAPVERVVIEPPLRSEKLFSDDEEEKKPKKTRRGRSGRSQALATFEASWDEEEVKPAEAKTEEKPVEEVKVEEKPVDEVKVEEKPVEEVKVEEKPVEKEMKPAEKELKEEEVEKKEEKVEEKEKKEEESWDFASDGNDSRLEWSDQEQSATAPTPTNTPTTPTNTPTPTTPTNTPTPTTPITIISSTTVASYTAVPDMMPLCTSPTTISPVLLQACRVLDLLLSSSLLLPACHCFQCYIPAVKKEPSLLCHFVDKLVRQIGAREMKEEEAKALTEIVTILVEDNECVTRAASDLVLELFLACQKKEEVSCIPKQLVLLVLSFYQQKREPWLITVFIHMFSTALSHHSMEQVTQCLVLLVATLQKLNAEDSQFLIAVCGMPIIDAILSVWSVMDKEALAALVPFAALLYGKTEKKEEIVELVLHLCGIALKRSIQLQPLNVKKCDEDADLVKVNSMIGELLFVMVRVNAESFKKGLQCLPAEKVSVIQEQLRHTIQVKQSETNAAKRRNASRMPVKLDASKFTNE